MKQCISISNDHHLNVFCIGIYIIFQTFSVIVTSLFVIAQHIVRLPDLKVEIGIIWRFCQHFQKKLIVALGLFAKIFNRAIISAVIDSKRKSHSLILGSVKGSYLFMDDSLVMKKFFVKKAFYIIGVNAVSAIHFVVIFSWEHSHTLRIICDQCIEASYIQIYNIFITIKHQNPIIGSTLQRKVSCSTEITDPIKMKDFIGVFLSNGNGIIGRTCVHQNDFMRIVFKMLLDSRQKVFHIFLFVFHDDTDRDRGHEAFLSLVGLFS